MRNRDLNDNSLERNSVAQIYNGLPIEPREYLNITNAYSKEYGKSLDDGFFRTPPAGEALSKIPARLAVPSLGVRKDAGNGPAPEPIDRLNVDADALDVLELAE